MQPIDWLQHLFFGSWFPTKGPVWTHSFGPCNRVGAWEGGGGRSPEGFLGSKKIEKSLILDGFEVMNEALASKGEDEPAPADEVPVEFGSYKCIDMGGSQN